MSERKQANDLYIIFHCHVCGNAPEYGSRITNINPVGVPGKWVCDEHLTKEIRPANDRSKTSD